MRGNPNSRRLRATCIRGGSAGHSVSAPRDAVEVAAELAARFGVRLWNVVAHGGKPVDPTAVAEIVGHQREDLKDHPVDALVAAAADADLLVVASRGLHGLRSLGSISERVAHRARCSVLVVRRAPWESRD